MGEMVKFTLPYGRGNVSIEFPESRLAGTLVSGLHEYKAGKTQEELIKNAMEKPYGSKRLCELAKGKKRVTIIASDHTRPVPSKLILPPMLKEIRDGSPDAEITILVATGCHRAISEREMLDKFGDEIFGSEKIIIHDCDDFDMLKDMGLLPSGGRLLLNRLAVDADLLVSEGFIEPHFFAGYSGGRKSVMPGVAARETVVYNHNADFIDSEKARTGILDGNPIHEDMLYAARTAGLAYIVNVVINAEKEVIYAVAGDFEEAHLAGCEFLSGKCGANRIEADIAVTTNGGYPLDQNIYQAVKSMTAAEASVREGGVIIVFAESEDGHGAEDFYQTFKQEKSLDRMLAAFRATPREKTIPDQWQSQIFARVLKRARVIYVSGVPDEMVRDMHMTPARDFTEALKIADETLGHDKGTIAVIPDGVSVIVTA